MLDFPISLISMSSIIKWPSKIIKRLLNKKEDKKDLRIKKNEEDIRAIKEALHNFYNAASEGKEPRLDTNIQHSINDFCVKGIEHLKDIHN